VASSVIAPQSRGTRAGFGDRSQVHLRFDVPQGNVTDLMSIIYSLRHKFERLMLEIRAEQGAMTTHEYQMNVEEILRDMGIFVEDAEIAPEF
jgi:hypothetical protein